MSPHRPTDRRWRADRRDCRGGHFLAPQVRVIENAGPNAAAWPGSLAAGKPVCAASMSTMADGIAVAVPGGVPFAHVRAFADSVRTVSEDALSRAAAVHGAAKLIVEPAGAAAVAVLMTSVPELGRIPVCAVLSGGNIDPLVLTCVITHGLRGVFSRSEARHSGSPRRAEQAARRGQAKAGPACSTWCTPAQHPSWHWTKFR